MKKLFFPLLALIVFSSCSNYYKAITTSEPANAANIADLKAKNRYFILRDGSQAFSMANISFSDDRKTLQCDLAILPSEHKLHLTNGRDGKMKYRKPTNTEEDETAVLNEVHIYITPDEHIANGPYTLGLNKVLKTEVIEKDKIKTRKSHAVGIIIAISGVGVFVGGIAAIILSNIPIL
jgi:hypothetical protein